MALLIFPSENLAPSLATLLDPDRRKDIAAQVNEAILESHGARKEARLRNLVKLRAWAEQKARDAKRDIPEHLDLGLRSEKDDANHPEHRPGDASGDAEMANNGEPEPMVT